MALLMRQSHPWQAVPTASWTKPHPRQPIQAQAQPLQPVSVGKLATPALTWQKCCKLHHAHGTNSRCRYRQTVELWAIESHFKPYPLSHLLCALCLEVHWVLRVVGSRVQHCGCMLGAIGLPDPLPKIWSLVIAWAKARVFVLVD